MSQKLRCFAVINDGISMIKFNRFHDDVSIHQIMNFSSCLKEKEEHVH